MFLFIFESIGTSELLLIGIVALIFLGPRKMPEMAKKIGKIMAEFRGATSEFKQTWEREINFEEEIKSLDLNALEAETKPIAREDSTAAAETTDVIEVPAIRQIDPTSFDHTQAAEPAKPKVATDDNNDKKNWL